MRLSSRIRELLRSEKYTHGLTINALSVLTGARPKTVEGALERMPDAYVDHWTKERAGKGRMSRVYCVVVPPPDCPHPNQIDP